jgi:hypothetical protein
VPVNARADGLLVEGDWGLHPPTTSATVMAIASADLDVIRGAPVECGSAGGISRAREVLANIDLARF